MTLFGAALWSLAGWLAVAFAISATGSLREGAETDLVSLAACHVLVYSLVLFVLLRVYAPQARLRDFLAVRKTSPVAILGALLLGVGSSPILNKVGDLWAARFPSSDADGDDLQDKMVHAVAGGRFTLILVLGVVLPLVYEVFFRGAIYSSIRRRVGMPGVRDEVVPMWALVTSTLLFAVSFPTALPMWILLGLMLGWIRQASGSLLPSVVARISFALVPLAPLFLRGGSVDDDLVYTKPMWIAAVASCVAGGLLILWTQFRSDAAQLARKVDETPVPTAS